MSFRWASDVDPEQLDPEFRSDVEQLFGDDEAGWIGTRGYASIDEQNVLYQKYLNGGPLAAPPGKSAHNWRLAMDFARLMVGKEIWDYNSADWKRIEDKVDAHPRLHGGWKFPAGEQDPDHIEAVKWFAFRDQLIQDGKWNT